MRIEGVAALCVRGQVDFTLSYFGARMLHLLARLHF
jgi:hypothetical protein